MTDLLDKPCTSAGCAVVSWPPHHEAALCPECDDYCVNDAIGVRKRRQVGTQIVTEYVCIRGHVYEVAEPLPLDEP